MRHLKLPKLSFTQKAIVIVLILGTLYTGAFIYEQYRLTIEHNAGIQKWCMTHKEDFQGDDAKEKLNLCERYFGKYHLPFRNKDYKKENTF